MTLVIALSIGLGVGINQTVFTWMESLILNPYPVVNDAERIVALNTTETGDAGAAGARPISYPPIRISAIRTIPLREWPCILPAAFICAENPQESGEVVWGQTGVEQLFLRVVPAFGMSRLGAALVAFRRQNWALTAGVVRPRSKNGDKAPRSKVKMGGTYGHLIQ